MTHCGENRQNMQIMTTALSTEPELQAPPTRRKVTSYMLCSYHCLGRNRKQRRAPTSKNYPEIRLKLRSQMKKRQEERKKKTDQLTETESGQKTEADPRSVDELVQFINRSENEPGKSSEVYVPALQKASKKQEKVCMESQAQKEEKEESHKEQFQGQQELQRPKAVKRKTLKHDSSKLHTLAGNFQVATEPVPNSANIHRDLEQTEEPDIHHTEPSYQPGAAAEPPDSADVMGAKQKVSGKQRGPLSFFHGLMHHPREEKDTRKPKQTSKNSKLVRKSVMSSRAPADQPKPFPWTKSKATVADLVSQEEPAKGKGKVNKKLKHSTRKSSRVSPEPSGATRHPQDRDQERNEENSADDSIDEIFTPKDSGLNGASSDVEVEKFKQFCVESNAQTQPRLPRPSVDWSSLRVKKPSTPTE